MSVADDLKQKVKSKRFMVRENDAIIFDTKVPISIWGGLKELQTKYKQSNYDMLSQLVLFTPLYPMLEPEEWETFHNYATQTLGIKPNILVASLIREYCKAIQESTRESSKSNKKK